MGIDDFAVRAAALADRFALPADERRPLSVATIAVEAALGAVTMHDHLGPFHTALKAMELCPAGATPFEKGATFGLALALASEATAKVRVNDAGGVSFPVSFRAPD